VDGGNKTSTPPCRGVKIAQFKDPDGNRIGIMKSPAM
jgi:predicted enzyme related to lactoylglutathione lyase